MSPAIGETGWTSGDRVVVRAASCTILRSDRFADCGGLQLSPSAPPDTPFGTLLVPFDRPRRIEAARRPRAMRPRRWLHLVRRAGAAHHPFGGLRSAARAKIDLLPYQLEPALAILRHARLRVLIADAVGLGKTIQAGLVLAEVLGHDASRRALVLMPAGLRHQWRSELAAHFEIDACICDALWLRRRARDLPLDLNPWSLPGTYLVSVDFIKRPEVLTAIEELPWDVVVVDEAHGVTSGTDRRAAVDAVAARARRVLLLTATPHSGDESQFDALCRIGEGPARTPIVMFRRKRSDVASAAPRRSILLRIRLSEPERRMHQLLERYTGRVWRESHARGDRLARLVAIVLRKRALSSAGSLAASLARRIDLLSRPDTFGTQQLALPLSDNEDDVEDRVRDEVLGAPGLSDPAAERRWLAVLLQAARTASRDERKVARLRRLLLRVGEPAIVFTEYRDTLTRLYRTLRRPAIPVLTLHGGMSAAERRMVQQAFNEGPALLLATDAAAEGLNLQRRCRLVIHFELPWNPARLEQRTGRVDRMGQTRRVHEIAFVADDTAERLVLAPLARRAAGVRGLAAGEDRMLELLCGPRVAEAVMNGRPDGLMNGPGARTVCPEMSLAPEAAREASRIAEQRRWLRSDAAPRTSRGPGVTSLAARAAGTPAVTLVHTLALTTADGRIVHSEALVVGLSQTARPLVVRSSADATRALSELLPHAQPRVDILARRRFDALARDVLPLHGALIAALHTRELAIAEGDRSPARELVQAGLFDRRALRDAERHAAVRRRRGDDADGALKALESAAPVAETVTLEAALLRTGWRG